jgi:prephenate dehydrogenase
MKQVTIIGLGMIGASFGLALKTLEPPLRVIGHDNQYDAARRATSLKAVDKVERNLETALAGSDLVVLATPIGAILELLETIPSFLSEGCLVTDVGSTKREIVSRAQKLLPPSVDFVGGHPMTGRATSGVDEPDPSLFRGTIYCLTPSARTSPQSVSRLSALVERLGATPYFADPEEHDGLVAGISHLPYLLSVALMRAVAAGPGWREMSTLAAGGFDTATRLTTHDPRVFADILTTNGENVSRHLDAVLAELDLMRQKLLRGDQEIFSDLEKAHLLRMRWEEQRNREKSERETAL